MVIILILCSVCLVASNENNGNNLENQVLTPSPEGPHLHPIYRYSCNEDLSVTLKGVNGADGAVVVSGNIPNCGIQSIPGHFGSFKISKECLGASTNLSLSRVVNIEIIDKNEGESIISPASTVIVSGKHKFRLTCDPIPKGGVDRIALAETGVKDVDELGKMINEVKNVDMWFKEAESKDALDISNLYIGDMFFMYIKYLGDPRYTLLPMNCSAHSGTYRLASDKGVFNLWDMSNGCLKPDSSNLHIMDHFIRDESSMIHAKLHAFRFAGTASEADITISCIVKICSVHTDDCDDKCSVTPIPTPAPTTHPTATLAPTNQPAATPAPILSARKKRQAQQNHSVHTVSKTFKVKDQKSNGGCFQLLDGLLFLSALSVVMKRFC